MLGGWAPVLPRFVEDAVRAIRGFVEEHPGERVYAAGFYDVYLDGSVVHLPDLAVGCRGGSGEPAGDFWHVDWNPADFGHDLHYESPELEVAVAAATRPMTEGSDEAWERGERQVKAMLTKACRQIRAALDGHVPRDFVVYVQDLGEDGARTTIGARRFRALFPAQDADGIERRRVAALPIDERVEYLLGRLGQFGGPIPREEAEEQLVAIGATAVPALLRLLDDPEGAWRAAMLLGRIGDTRPEVIGALRARFDATSGEGSTHRWCASALAHLGDTEWLFTHIDGPAIDPMAVAGLLGPYSSFRDETSAAPLDYGPLIRLLESSPAVVALVEEEMRPGRPECTLRLEEVDTALAALDSPHRLVRRHAADVLGDRRLGAAVRKRVIPVLARIATDDPAEDVRFAARVGLSEWR